ncbi:MAG: helix-turn-helix transcriptional regulator [Ardenticatenia bacterium]|nr:helix-turn-helix transcriptional regulator [Ardenticatenia bacterium]
MFGEYLKALRRRAGISQEALAEEAGISSAYISQLESGQRNPPSPHVLRHMATALGVPYLALLHAAGYLRTEDIVAYVLRAFDEVFAYAEGRDRLVAHLRAVVDRWNALSPEEQRRRLALTDADHIAELFVEELLAQQHHLLTDMLLRSLPLEENEEL